MGKSKSKQSLTAKPKSNIISLKIPFFEILLISDMRPRSWTSKVWSLKKKAPAMAMADMPDEDGGPTLRIVRISVGNKRIVAWEYTGRVNEEMSLLLQATELEYLSKKKIKLEDALAEIQLGRYDLALIDGVEVDRVELERAKSMIVATLRSKRLKRIARFQAKKKLQEDALLILKDETRSGIKRRIELILERMVDEMLLGIADAVEETGTNNGSERIRKVGEVGKIGKVEKVEKPSGRLSAYRTQKLKLIQEMEELEDRMNSDIQKDSLTREEIEEAIKHQVELVVPAALNEELYDVEEIVRIMTTDEVTTSELFKFYVEHDCDEGQLAVFICKVADVMKERHKKIPKYILESEEGDDVRFIAEYLGIIPEGWKPEKEREKEKEKEEARGEARGETPHEGGESESDEVASESEDEDDGESADAARSSDDSIVGL